MREADLIANANSSFFEALRRFEALTLADQLPLLALVLRDELDPLIGLLPQPPALKSAPAVMDQAAGNELQALAVAAKLQFLDGSDLLGDTGQDRKAARARNGAAVTNTRMLALVLTMIVSFSVSFALMWRERATVASAPPIVPPQTLVVAQTAVAAQMLVVAQPQPLQERPIPAEPARPAAAHAAPPSPKFEAGESDDAPARPLPLAFNVYNRRYRHIIEGFVVNTSRKPLSVTLQVVGVDGEQRSQAELSLAPGEQQTFGTDSGLDIHANDRVILHSPPYPDGTIEVP